LARITSHWYTSQASGPISTSLRVWETEYADLDDAFSTTWHSSGAANEGFTWAGYIFKGVVKANLSAFLHWIGAQANSNASGLVTITGSGSSSKVSASASLWAFAMFSRYIRPDAVRIGTTGAPANTQSSAFKNTDGTIAVVFLNSGSATQSVSVGGVSIGSVKAYHMDNSVSTPTALTTTLSGGNVVATLPGYSLVTIVISTGSGTTPPTTTSIKTTLTTSKTSSPSTTSSGGVSQHYDQCGGQGWTGPTTCASPYTCTVSNAYYSQCL